MVVAQGGDGHYIDDPSRFPPARIEATVRAPRDGYIHALDAERIGRALVALGGGRRVQDDVVDPAVGFVILRKVGSHVRQGEPVLVIHANQRERLHEAETLVTAALRMGAEPVESEPLILDRR